MRGWRSHPLADGRLWVHVAALIAIATGLVDVWYFHTMHRALDLVLVLSGLAVTCANAGVSFTQETK